MYDFLNIGGTLRSIFSLGKHLNQVFIRANNGILEGKNNSGDYLPILNIDDASISLTKTWSSDKISSEVHSPISKVLANNTSTQGIQGGVYTRVLFTTEVTDSLSELTSSVFTSSLQQTVLVSTSLSITGMGNGRLLYLHIYKNGSSYIQTNNNSGGGATSGIVGVNMSFPIDVNVNDTIEVYVYHTDGSNTRNLTGTQMLSIVGLR